MIEAPPTATAAAHAGEAPPVRRPRGRPRKRGSVRRYAQVTIRLTPDTVAELDRLAESEGEDGRSVLVRRAVDAYLRRVEKRAARGTGGTQVQADG